MSRRLSRRRWIEPQAFADLRRQAGLSRAQAALLLDVTPRTIQNWETGGACIPWMAFRLLRITQGYGLPGSAWEAWTVRGDVLIAPNGRGFKAWELEQLQYVFSMARLWHSIYAETLIEVPPRAVIPFPDRKPCPPPKNGKFKRVQYVGGGGL